jgi:hypothetical protein
MVKGFKITRRLMDAPTLKALRTRDLFTADVESDDDIRAALHERPIDDARGTSALRLIAEV